MKTSNFTRGHSTGRELFKGDETSPPHTSGDGQFDRNPISKNTGFPLKSKTMGRVHSMSWIIAFLIHPMQEGKLPLSKGVTECFVISVFI